MGIPCNTVKNRANSVQTPPDMEIPCKTMQFAQKHGITMLFSFFRHKLHGNAMSEQTRHIFFYVMLHQKSRLHGKTMSLATPNKFDLNSEPTASSDSLQISYIFPLKRQAFNKKIGIP